MEGKGEGESEEDLRENEVTNKDDKTIRCTFSIKTVHLYVFKKCFMTAEEVALVLKEKNS